MKTTNDRAAPQSELESLTLAREIGRLEADIDGKIRRQAELHSDAATADSEIAEAAAIQARALIEPSIGSEAVDAAMRKEEVASRKARNARAAIGHLEGALPPLREQLADARRRLADALEVEADAALVELLEELKPLLVDAFERIHALAATAKRRDAVAEAIGSAFVMVPIATFGVPRIKPWTPESITAALGTLSSSRFAPKGPPKTYVEIDLGPPVGVGILKRLSYRTRTEGIEFPAGHVANIPRFIADRLCQAGLAVRLSARAGRDTVDLDTQVSIVADGGSSVVFPPGRHVVSEDVASKLVAAGGVRSGALTESEIEAYSQPGKDWRRQVVAAVPPAARGGAGIGRLDEYVTPGGRIAQGVDLGNVAEWPREKSAAA